MQFSYFLRPFRPTFPDDMTDAEAITVDRHLDYLDGLRLAGKVLMAGRCLDVPFGIVILSVEAEAEAATIAAQDPAVKEGIMTADLHPFRVALWSVGESDGRGFPGA